MIRVRRRKEGNKGISYFVVWLGFSSGTAKVAYRMVRYDQEQLF